MKTKIYYLIVILLIYFILELIAKAAPRASAWAPYHFNNKVGVIMPVPNLKVWQSAGYGELPFWLTTDENGFRNLANLSTNKQARLKILFLGDSYTYGYGVSDSMTWPQYLLNILSEREVSAFGKNTGVPWMTIDQQISAYHYASQTQKFDLVILGFCSSNDYPEQYDIQILSKNFINHGIFPWLLAHSSSLRAFMKVSFMKSAQMQTVVKSKALQRPAIEALASSYEYKFRSFVAEIQKNRQHLLIVNIDPPPLVRKDQSSPKDYLIAKANVRKLSEELGIEFIDTSILSDSDYLWPKDFHLSAVGNYHTAEMVFNSKTLKQLIE